MKPMKVRRAMGIYGEGTSQDRPAGQRVPVPSSIREQPALPNADHVREDEWSPESPAQQVPGRHEPLLGHPHVPAQPVCDPIRLRDLASNLNIEILFGSPRL